MTKDEAIKRRRTYYVIFLIIMTLFFVCKALEICVCVNTLPAELKVDGPLWITCAILWAIAAKVNYRIVLRKNYDDYSKDELQRRETNFNTAATISGVVTGNCNLYLSSNASQEFANSQGIYRSARQVSCVGILIFGAVINVFSFFYSGGPGDLSFTYFILFKMVELVILVVMCIIENIWRVHNTYIATGNWNTKNKFGIFILYAILIAIYYSPVVCIFTVM